jgi:hypothetical protein
MINNNMIQLAATTHQHELRRAMPAAHAQAARGDAASAPNHRLHSILARMLNNRDARRTQGSTVVPRISL